MSGAGRIVGMLSALSCLAGLSCGGDDEPPAEGGGSSAAQEIEKVAMALTGGLAFENSSVVQALIPDPSNDTVKLDQEGTTLSLEPGLASLLPLEVTNPESSDNQVAAVLLQFGGSDEHIEVEVEGSEDETESFTLPFEVDDGICDALCNKIVQLTLKQAVRMTDDTISEHLERLLELDCSDDGDEDACESDEPSENPEPGGGGTSGGGGTNVGATARAFATALIAANTALCACDGFSSEPCDALVPAEAIACVRDSVDDASGDADAITAVNALEVMLRQATPTCSACNPVACPATLFADGLDTLPEALAARILDCAGGTLPPAQPDAGT